MRRAWPAASRFLFCLIALWLLAPGGAFAQVYTVSPTTGPSAGGTVVTITGFNFTGTTGVTFGGMNAATFTIVSDTEIIATTPAGVGIVDVRVTNASGWSAKPRGFTYISAPPTLSSITPSSGPTEGGTVVTITGTNLAATSAVTFGGAPATGLTIIDDTTIRATTPAGTGIVDVSVTTSGGSATMTGAYSYTYSSTLTVTMSATPSTATPGSNIRYNVTVSVAGGTATNLSWAAPLPASLSFDSFNSWPSGPSLSFSYSGGVVRSTFSSSAAPGNYSFSFTAKVAAAAPAGPLTTTATATANNAASASNSATAFVSPPISVSLAATPNPSVTGQTVTMTATVTAAAGSPTGTVTFKDGATTLGTAAVAGGIATFQTSALASGPHTLTAVYSGDPNFTGGTSSPVAQTVNALPATTTTVTSSANPSAPGQAVTFTARVTAGNGTPTGSVTFSDGAVALGTATLASGTATFITASLANGAHSITAQYLGVTGFAASTSSVLTQTVAIPADSIKLRAMQIAATKVVAQNAGQAIAGAIGDAIDEGFSNGGALITPSGSSVRFNFAADPDQPSPANAARRESRINDAFAAIERNTMPAKTRPATSREAKDWLLWADVRGSGIDRWSGSGGAQAQLYGWQVNTLIGLTHRLTPSFLIGVVGGYETFDYTSSELNGKLKGDGWTIGSYLGWKFTPTVRFDLALAYSGIGYNGSAGTAQGNFDGHRWLLSTGFTGQYKAYGFDIEPSAKVYALWEHENAYTDTLGTRQGERDFSTGRASGGVKFAYPVAWTDDITLAPYLGLYGDYYFTRDDAGDVDSGTTPALASTPLIDGWSARTTGGLTARFAGGGALALGAELGGIGSDVEIWTFRARGNVPF